MRTFAFLLQDELYMQRCFQLAQMGAGLVAPNPLVGAVLVYNGRIIGEGHHMKYGRAHAEVNCIHSVAEEDRRFISAAVMYVSLEPCAHFGKTPPCCDLIIEHKIAEVVVACRDSFEKVNGEGIRRMQAAGIIVREGILEKEAIDLNRRFFTFNKFHRPYIILKWAQSANGCIATGDLKPVRISNDITNKLVHRWRSEEAAIVVGKNTALSDDPELTNRHWEGGSQPLRIVVDNKLTLPKNLKFFNNEVPTIVINTLKETKDGNVDFIKISSRDKIPESICRILYEKGKSSLIVEGGSILLNSFIEAGLWDEVRVITNTALTIKNGLAAPTLNTGAVFSDTTILTDNIRVFRNIPFGDK